MQKKHHNSAISRQSAPDLSRIASPDLSRITSPGISRIVAPALSRTLVITRQRFHPNLVFYAPLENSLTELISGRQMSITRDGTVWHFNSQNVLTEYTADTPAFGPKGLWTDGAGTNLVEDSRDLTTANWTNSNVDSVARDAVGLDGKENTACTLTDTDFGYMRVGPYTIADDNATHVVAGCWIKEKSVAPSGSPYIRLQLINGTTELDFKGIFDPSTGDITAGSGDATAANLRSFKKNGWWFFEINGANNSTGNTWLYFSIIPSGGAAAGYEIIVDNVQVELNRTYCSSPIITSGSSASRATQAADGANGLSPALSGLDSRVEAALGSTFSTLFHLTPQFDSTDIDGNGILEWSTGDSVTTYSNITESPTGTFTVTSGGTATDNSVAFDISLLPRYTPVDITFNCTVGGNFRIYDGTTYQNMGIIDTGVQTFRGAISQYDTAIIRLCTNTMSIEDVTITSALPLLSTGDLKFAIDGTELAITDGTNTATVAHGGFDAGDELWLIGQADASTSKLRAGIIGDSSVTWGSEAAYTGGMNPGTNLLVFEDNEEYAQISEILGLKS